MWEVTQIGSINRGLVEWPAWVEYLTHVSHVTTTLTSSTNLYIYAAKVRYSLGLVEFSWETEIQVLARYCFLYLKHFNLLFHYHYELFFFLKK